MPDMSASSESSPDELFSISEKRERRLGGCATTSRGIGRVSGMFVSDGSVSGIN